MKIEIEVSTESESTQSPYWLIIDPRQNMKADVTGTAWQITGVFFSRAEAEAVLKGRAHHYSDKARVYCMSGCYSGQYHEQYITNRHK